MSSKFHKISPSVSKFFFSRQWRESTYFPYAKRPKKTYFLGLHLQRGSKLKLQPQRYAQRTKSCFAHCVAAALAVITPFYGIRRWHLANDGEK